MKQLKTYIAFCCLALLCFSCTDDFDILSGSGSSATGKVQMVIDVSAPVNNSNALTRTISADNESSLNGDFVVFAFDGEDDDSNFLWEICTGDTNENTNLQNSLDDFSDSTSITWHPDGEGGRLYIESDTIAGPIYLIVLANVDITTANSLKSTLMSGNYTRKDVIDSLYVFDFEAVTNEEKTESGFSWDKMNDELEYIPMAGKVTLEDGINLGGKGTLQLRRSLAKISLTFNWNDDYYNEKYLNITNEDGEHDFDVVVDTLYKTGLAFFKPEYVVAVYVNNYATVFADNVGVPNISTLNDTVHHVEFKVPEPTYNESSNSWSTSVDLYVPETKNSKKDGYKDLVSGTSSQLKPDEDTRISVLVEGYYHDNDTTISYCWYRLDFIPAEGSAEEIDSIVRNNNYRFTLTNITKMGSGGEIDDDDPDQDYVGGYFQAMKLTKPDNYRMTENAISDFAIIEDEDILSVTADYENAIDGVPYYIGVSSTDVYITDTLNSVASVKVITNISGAYLSEDGWGIDYISIPSTQDYSEEGEAAFSFIYDSSGETLWIWLDHIVNNDGDTIVEAGDTFAFYITAGNIRKKMKIIVTSADATDEDDDITEGDDGENN